MWSFWTLSLCEVICSSLKATHLLWDQESCWDAATSAHFGSSGSAEWVLSQETVSQGFLMSYLQRLIVMVRQRKRAETNHPGTKGEMVFFFLPPVPFSLLESVRTQGKHMISGEHGRLKAKTLMTKNLSGESSEKSIAWKRIIPILLWSRNHN